MSAFIVSRNHIHYLVAAYQHYGEFLPERNSTELGNLLWQENIKSVQYRYHGEPLEVLSGPGGDDYRYKYKYPPPMPLNPVIVLKLAASFEYQSCEHPEWEQSEAYSVVEAIKSAAIHHLPGYEKAPWEIA